VRNITDFTHSTDHRLRRSETRATLDPVGGHGN